MAKIKLLFAEDEETTRKNITKYLQTLYDVDVIEAVDGQDAWEKYNNIKPNILFTDLTMDYINGLELIKKIREIDQNIKIYVISAYSEQNKIDEAISYNISDYIIKPISRNDIKRIISTLSKTLT